MLTERTDTVTVWSANGAPTRLVWRHQRWAVIDEPTRLENAWVFVTHVPPVSPNGWRLTARVETSDETRVFDLIERSDGQFELLHVYD